jgi:hypothetical protein
MPRIVEELFESLTATEPRLPAIARWLMEQVWHADRYPHEDASEFLKTGEAKANELEATISAAAWRLYDEFQPTPPPERRLSNFLTEQRPCGAVIFDGLSLREVPAILHLAKESGLKPVEVGFTTSAIPSETVDFVAQRLGIANTSPSQLPTRQTLREQGIAAYYLPHANARELLDASLPSLLLWSSFPDHTYKDSGARFAEHFAQLDRTLKTAWTNTVQQIPSGRRILVTSDHGYVFFGSGLSLPRKNEELTEITRRFAGQRSCRLRDGERPLEHPDVVVMHDPADKPVMMIRGRVQTHTPGAQSSLLYKHGGLSLMEMIIPWVVLE